MKRLREIPLPVEHKSIKYHLEKAIKYASVSRNMLAVVVTTLVAYYWPEIKTPFMLSANVKPGIPPISLPPSFVQYNNRTIGFFEMTKELGDGIIVLPLVAVLANMACAKSRSGLIIIAGF